VSVPRPSLISRALRDAIAHCKMMFQAEMSCEVPGTKPPPHAQGWRERATEYNILLKKIDPREGKKGPVGEKPQVAPPPGASA
jgi:hypothetical protein